MKKLSLFLLLISFQLIANAQLFQETFDGWPNQNWTLYSHGANTSDNWTLVDPSDTPDGDSVIYHDDYSGGSDNWIVLPAISLTNPAKLIFEERNGYMSWYNYSGVLVSTGSGDPADGDFVEIYESSTSYNSWNQTELPLTDYTGQTVYIAFQMITDYDHYWYLNNISVEEIVVADDLALIGTDIQGYYMGAPDEISLTVQNNGGEEITAGTTIDLYIDDVQVDAQSTAQAIQYLEVDTLYYYWDAAYGSGLHEFKFIKTVSDDSTKNDTLITQILIAGSDSYVEDIESGDPFDYNFITDFNTYSNISSASYHGNYYQYMNNYSNVTDTLFFNKYLLSDSAYFSTYLYSEDDFSYELLYSTDAVNWISVKSQAFTGSTIYQQFYADLTGIEESEVYLALVVNAASSYTSFRMDYMLFPAEVTGVPACDAIEITESFYLPLRKIDLRWNSVVINDVPLTDVRFYLGTDGNGDSSPTNMVNGSTSYNSYYREYLDYNTTYYYQVVPIGRTEEATGCPIYSFHVPEEPFITPDTTITFDDEIIGWTEADEYLPDVDSEMSPYNSSWNTDNWNNDWMNGSQALRVNLYTSYNHEMIISPKIILGDATHVDSLFLDISMTLYNSETVGQFDDNDSLFVLISDDGLWSTLDTVAVYTISNPLGLNETLALSLDAYTDTIQVAFYAQSTTNDSDNDIFIDNFQLWRLPENTALDSLLANDVSVTNFDPETLTYTIYVPVGTSVPTISATAADSLAEVNITQGDGIPSSATVEVVAQNNNFAQTYTVNFVEQTSVISLTGTLSFNDVEINTNETLILTISNNGNTALNVSDINLPEGFSSDWTNGEIATGSTQDVNITFAPTEEKAYSGTIEVISDATSGTNTIAVSGTGISEATSIENLTNAINFEIYPNPASDKIYLPSDAAKGNYMIIDLNGKTILKGQMQGNSINIESLEKGLYILKIIDDKTIWQSKLMCK